jgi:hypothetical protein
MPNIDSNVIGIVGRRHPETAKKAAFHVKPKTGTQRWRVFTWIWTHGGATDEEIQTGLKISGDSERPRRTELVEGGWIEDSMGTRKTGSGEDAIVWTLTSKGLRTDPYA